METETGKKGDVLDRIDVLDLRRKLRERKEERKEYSREMDAKLAERRDQSAEDFWSTRGEYGSIVAAVDKADEEYYLAKSAGDSVAMEKAKRVVGQLPRNYAGLATLRISWIGSCMGEGVGGEVNPATGLPKWAERAMPVKPPTVDSAPVSQ